MPPWRQQAWLASRRFVAFSVHRGVPSSSYSVYRAPAGLSFIFAGARCCRCCMQRAPRIFSGGWHCATPSCCVPRKIAHLPHATLMWQPTRGSLQYAGRCRACLKQNGSSGIGGMLASAWRGGGGMVRRRASSRRDDTLIIWPGGSSGAGGACRRTIFNIVRSIRPTWRDRRRRRRKNQHMAFGARRVVALGGVTIAGLFRARW